MNLGIVFLATTAFAKPVSWPDVKTGWEAADIGDKDSALIVAIEQYDQLDNVPGARVTGEAWEEYFTEHRQIPLSRVKVLRDSNATREQILQRAGQVARDMDPEGILWVVYVGHGAPSKSQTEGLLVGADTRQTAASLYARGVSQTELEQAVSVGPQQDMVLVFDACFSGRNQGDTAFVPGLSPMLSVDLAQSISNPKRTTVFSAGKSNEFAGPLPGLAQPGFSYLMLGALRGWGDVNEDGVITSKEAVDFAGGYLGRLEDRTQTPELLGNPELVMAKGFEGGPDLKKLMRSGATVAQRNVGLRRVRDGAFVGLAGVLVYSVALFGTNTAYDNNPSEGLRVFNNSLVVVSAGTVATSAALMIRGLASADSKSTVVGSADLPRLGSDRPEVGVVGWAPSSPDLPGPWASPVPDAPLASDVAGF